MPPYYWQPVVLVIVQTQPPGYLPSLLAIIVTICCNILVLKNYDSSLTQAPPHQLLTACNVVHLHGTRMVQQVQLQYLQCSTCIFGAVCVRNLLQQLSNSDATVKQQ
jgi:hypothetical protein